MCCFCAVWLARRSISHELREHFRDTQVQTNNIRKLRNIEKNIFSVVNFSSEFSSCQGGGGEKEVADKKKETS
jgi:hypothetical protein